MINFNPHGYKQIDGKTAIKNMELAQYTLHHYDHWRPVYKIRLSHYRLNPKKYKFRIATKRTA
jgi:hypothetical protein